MNTASPQPAPAANLGPKLFDFATFSRWVNHAQHAWKDAGVPVNYTLCIDAKGRHCFIGRDFMIARDDGSFPVTVHLRRADLAEELGIATNAEAA
jgi:hypothetical protein